MGLEYSVAAAAAMLRVHPRSLRDWIQSGRFAARLKGRAYFLPAALVEKWKAHQDRVCAWPRLVDVSHDLGIHRNQGESLCRAGGYPVEKDLSDDYRIEPAAAVYLRERISAETVHEGWMPLVDLAAELALPRNVLDTGLRRNGLKFAKNYRGQVLLPPATVEWVRVWRRKLDGYRGKAPTAGEGVLFPIQVTAARAAEKFAPPGTDAHRQKVAVLIHRYRYWARHGLAVVRRDRHLLLDEPTHLALVDEVSLMEASRLTGVKVGRLKRWVASGAIRQTSAAPTRRSFSFSSVLAAVMESAQDGHPETLLPAQTLPRAAELERRLRWPPRVSWERMLTLFAGAAPSDLEALSSGVGAVSSSVWRTIDQWLQAIGAGRPPAMAASVVSERSADIAAEPAVAAMLSWFVGVRDEHLLAVLKPSPHHPAEARKVAELCRHVSSGGKVRIYDPRLRFAAGELLLDPGAEDLGTVQTAHASHMEVQWMRRGPLKMSHRPAFAAS